MGRDRVDSKYKQNEIIKLFYNNIINIQEKNIHAISQYIIYIDFF